MSDITELKHMLNDRVMQVCEYLLPNGILEGSEWRVGSVDGEAGKSMGVHVSGAKAGVWADFNSGQGGDLIELWRLVRRLDLVKALEEIRDYLGVEKPEFYKISEKTYKKPVKPKCTAPKSQVLEYLESRMIFSDTLAKYKIAEDGNKIVFPFLKPNGELSLVKTREAVDGAKPKPTSAGCEPILFGWQAIDPNARTIALTEGEVDSLSLAQYGHDALSVPFGGGGGAKQQWIENDFENLERFETIYIVTDNDGPGEEAAQEIASRLGLHRCLRVILPFKDANECLCEGVTKETIDECFKNAKTMDPSGLRRVLDFADKVENLFYPEPGQHVGYKTAYGEIGDKLLFRPGELTIWTGATGAGKSQILSDNIPTWIEQGSKICMASLEMAPHQSLKRVVKQSTGCDRPTKYFLRQSLEWLNEGLMIYELVGKSGIVNLLEVFDYARAKYGCDQFIIDSLMRLGIASDDYVEQEKAVFEAINWTIQKNVHVHFVAHGRKSFGNVPESEDIKGASEIGANAFNIVSIWRNRQVEDWRENGTPEEIEKSLSMAGVIMNVAKQRNGDFEGKIGMNFDQETYQYTTGPIEGRHTRCYVR